VIEMNNDDIIYEIFERIGRDGDVRKEENILILTDPDGKEWKIEITELNK
jgi:hypothetical protein